MGVLCEEPEPAPAKYRAPARKCLHYKAGNMLLFKLLIEVSTLACFDISPTFAIIAPTGWFLVDGDIYALWKCGPTHCRFPDSVKNLT